MEGGALGDANPLLSPTEHLYKDHFSPSVGVVSVEGDHCAWCTLQSHVIYALHLVPCTQWDSTDRDTGTCLCVQWHKGTHNVMSVCTMKQRYSQCHVCLYTMTLMYSHCLVCPYHDWEVLTMPCLYNITHRYNAMLCLLCLSPGSAECCPLLLHSNTVGTLACICSAWFSALSSHILVLWYPLLITLCFSYIRGFLIFHVTNAFLRSKGLNCWCCEAW